MNPCKNNSNASEKLKIAQFAAAIEKYKRKRLYVNIELMTSILVIFLQAWTLFDLFKAYDGTGGPSIIVALILAYVLTDFINGFVHMYMDNNTAYHTLIGPFISSFHLHHSTLNYRSRHPLQIYFYESGTKFWLLGYLMLFAVVQQLMTIPFALNLFFVSIGVLSSIAELSHYWCHNASKANKLIGLLQKYHVLLSKEHHMRHHKYDNCNYAFLNGISDSLLNIISRRFYQGYKSKADKHTAAYLRASG